MLRIVGYKERNSEDGKTFFVLEIQGGIEMVLSQQTGQHYITARKTSISSTFSEETCKAIIGTEIPGRIVREECEPYEYIIKDTGEAIILAHRYVYVPEEEVQPANHQHQLKTDVNVFSSNGILEPSM